MSVKMDTLGKKTGQVNRGKEILPRSMFLMFIYELDKFSLKFFMTFVDLLIYDFVDACFSQKYSLTCCGHTYCVNC